MIDVAKKTTIMFIDHAANPLIVDQITLNNNNIDKLNLRLIKTSIHLFQFNLNVRYKIDKFNVVSDAFLRLFVTNNSRNSISINALNLSTYHVDIENVSILNTIHVFQKTLMSMMNDFGRKFIKKYFENKS